MADIMKFLLFCISCIHVVTGDDEKEQAVERRFLLDDLTHHDPLAYVSTSSLTFKNRTFYLNGKSLRIISGSFHYFRVVPQYWNDRLLKMKAAGLNTVQIYVPWNLHEETPGVFNFDGILNIRGFVQLVHSHGMNVIFRPGPYICAEWDLGGLPSWLLKDPNMQLRTNYPGYTHRVRLYFQSLLAQVVDLQYHRGGPIVAIQVENEFGSFSDDVQHLHFLKQLLIQNGMNELFITSDGFYNKNENGMDRAPFYKEALPTANFDRIDQGVALFRKIANLSQDFPLMVTEFWSGWFDQWGGQHHTTNIQDYEVTLRRILNIASSINFYMFHGGTNFGFTSGANWIPETSLYVSDVTSYDYDAPLNEAGDVTVKYNTTRNVIQSLIYHSASLPSVPQNSVKAHYGTVNVVEYLDFETMLKIQGREIDSYQVQPMEKFDQNFGYILYRTSMPHGNTLTFQRRPTDRMQVFINGASVAVIESWKHNTILNLTVLHDIMTQKSLTLDILVENRGRVNYEKLGWGGVMNNQRKGLSDNILLDNQPLHSWKIYPLDFSKQYLQSLSGAHGWKHYEGRRGTSPAIYRAQLVINHDPQDSFLLMDGWTKGFVAINKFNLGRYWIAGPQRTLYVPAPVLRKGTNEVLIFEQHTAQKSLTFQNMPLL